MRQNVEHHQSILLSSARGNLVAKHNLFTVIVGQGSKAKRPGVLTQHFQSTPVHAGIRRDSGAARRYDCPTGKAPRHFLHVLLRVTALNPEGVQLHQLTRVIFVDAALLLLRTLLLRIVGHRGILIPIRIPALGETNQRIASRTGPSRT